MPENEQTRDSHRLFFRLPPGCGHFVGRDRELAELMAFLSDKVSRKSILLVHGPRGVGKSTLVRQAIEQAHEQKLFNSYVWLDRSWALNLRSLDDKLNPDKPAEILDLEDLEESYTLYYFNALSRRREELGGRSEEVFPFLRALLKRKPYVLVIDDFDEYDGLGADDHGLCKYLENIPHPNKIVLTARLPEHKFSGHGLLQRLEVGLLSEVEVKDLVSQCGFGNLDFHQLVEQDLDATARYIWTVSGGLPEFITRFFLPMAERKGWLLDEPSDWEEAFEHFTAGYLVQRSQEELPSEYKKKHSDSVVKCTKKFKDLTDEERNVLIALALQEDVQNLVEEELVQALGYSPDGNRKEWAQFRHVLISLARKRLIARRLEVNDQKKGKDNQPKIIWVLLPFTKEFIKRQLFNGDEIEVNFYRAQADHWIRFLENSPQSYDIGQADRIYPVFLWCVANQEWERALNLGQIISVLFRKNHEGKEEKLTKVIDICKTTADIAQRPEMNNPGIAIAQWSLLAQIYSNLSEPDLALEYAKKAIQHLEQTCELDDVIEKWADLAAMIVGLSLLKGDIDQVQRWIGQMEAQGQEKHEGWQKGAAWLGRLHSDVSQAEEWLTKVARISYAQENYFIAIQSYTDLSILYLQNGNLEKALECVQQTKTIVNKSTLDEEMGQHRIRAITVEANIAQCENRRQDSKSLYAEARQLAKNAKLYSVADELQRQLDILASEDGELNPVSRVDNLLGVRVLWGRPERIQSDRFDSIKRVDEILRVNFEWEILKEQRCPICRREFVIEDLSENRLQSCQNCGNYFHIDCLKMAEGENCPICGASVTEIKQGGISA
jgi:tetratricopeptide (TPR) repeat protein